MLLAAFLLIWAADDAGVQPASSAFTRAEVVSDFRQFLTANDADGDGELDAAEWIAIVEPDVPAQPGSSETASNDAGPRVYRIGEFGQIDSDRDGKVSLEELIREPLASFDCMDSDRDLRLSDAEIDAGMERCPYRRAAGTGFISEPPADAAPDR